MSPFLALTLTAALSGPAAPSTPADTPLLTQATRLASGAPRTLSEARLLPVARAARAAWAPPA
ncbi:MAG: hypothetical protein M3Q55_08325, partial [Acidobacteriota bacterium]|nr:hypothetical protein [Acidobacteriota bacterium]